MAFHYAISTLSKLQPRTAGVTAQPGIPGFRLTPAQPENLAPIHPIRKIAALAQSALRFEAS